jgi:hypothetical protein
MDEKDSVTVSDTAQLLMKFGRRYNVAALALNGLDHNAGDLFRRQNRLE